MSHIPVLKSEVLANLEPVDFSTGWFLDGTFGRGGHTKLILDQFPESKIIGLDQDEEAVRFGKELENDRFKIHHGNFTNFADHVGSQKLCGALLDLGVSSPQLDEGRRGFSFYHNGPLDMRMDQSQGDSAADIVNTWGQQELEDLFFHLGEVRKPRRVVERILEARAAKPFEDTRKLAELIENTEGWRKKGQHPATRYFMAIRLQVNHELDVIPQVLVPLMNKIEMGGRVLVITFHSLEDRIVKHIFREMEDNEIAFRVNKKVIVPGRDEEKSNPRSRSAKLRVMQRGKRIYE